MNLSGNPIAQTFTITGTQAAGLPGIYLTKIGVFFKKKSATYAAMCYICETTNGVPDVSKIVGGAFLLPATVNISEDSSAETLFEFTPPVMLSADKEYAFYVYPDGNSPDYEMWVSEVGGTDKLTNKAVTSQPYPGVLYVSSNGRSWVPTLTQDIKFNLYRAKFTTNNGKLVMRNAKDEFLSLNLEGATGGIFRKTSGVPIQVGDIVYAANATNLTSILTTNNTIYPLAYVKSVDEVAGILFLENSNGRFTNGTNGSTTGDYRNLRIYRTPDPANTQYITETYRVANATISTIDDIKYHGFVPKFKMVEPTGSYISTEYYGTSNTTVTATTPNTKDGTATIPDNESLREYRDFERTVKSYSNEVRLGTFGTKGTATYEINMVSYSPYVSPVVSFKARTFNYIENIINNDDTNEWTKFGKSKSKYISKTVILDNPAEDLVVYVTGYRPKGTNIKAYVKFFNADSDPSNFDAKVWTELSYLNDGELIFSSPNNLEDYKEYTFGPPKANARPSGTANNTLYGYSDTIGDVAKDIPAGTLTYYDESDAIYRGFNMFGIKLVLLSDEGAKYPTMRDVRAIALQM